MPMSWAERLVHKTKPSSSSDAPAASKLDDNSVHREPPLADDVPTSMGDSCQSESASMGDGSTPRLVETREEPPRWSDFVEDPADLSDDGDGIDHEEASNEPTKSRTGRRRRHRGNRSRRSGNAVVAHGQEHRCPEANARGFQGSGQQDRDTVTLADLGLLLSTPETTIIQHCDSATKLPSAEPGSFSSSTRGPIGQRGMLGTTPAQFQALTISPTMASQASSHAYPMVGFRYACAGTPTEFMPQPMLSVSGSTQYGTESSSPCSQTISPEGASAESLRCWLQSGLLLGTGVDLTTELKAAAPTVYED